MARQCFGLVGPAKRAERPERRGEPCIEDVIVLRQRNAFACKCLCGSFVFGDINLAIGIVPGRYPVAPPQLAADAPGLDILHPVEEGLLPAFGDDFYPPIAHRLDRILRQFFGIDIPLVGQPRLDHHAAAIAKRRLDGARFEIMLDGFALGILGHMRDQETGLLHVGNDHVAHDKAV